MSSLLPGLTPSTDRPAAVPDPGLDVLRRALAPTYDVERLLGAGGMGSVYLGRDRTLDRAVAIKVIAPELALSPVVRERFLREARTVARLHHPNIVTVHAAGQARGALYFVMEYVPGESLRDRLARGPFDDTAAVAALRDLARALAYAHAQGIVHRDVKPENVLLDAATGRVLLTDFGIAALASPDVGDGRATGAGLVLGSPRYMSPEQAAGEATLDGRSDLYALGLVGYEMFAGRAAVDATSAAGIMMKQIMERPAPLATLAERVPPAVAEAIGRAIEKAPDNRWPDGDAMAEALDAAIVEARGGPGASAAVRAAGARRRMRRWAATAAAGAALVAAGAGWWATRHAGPPAGVDPRRSYLVAPFAVLGPDTPQFAWLREGSVSMLTLDLAQWRDLTVVDYERGLDLQRDLRVDASRAVGLADALRMARRAGVWTVVTGQVTGTGDSLLVDARVYDVASGRRLDEAHQSVARGADPRPLFDALARDLLDLAGAPPVTLGLTQSTTSSVAAYRDYLDGVRAMNAWQLARADSLFAAATDADSTFALAYYQRALAMGWRDKGAAAPTALLAQATRHAPRLPAHERALVDAYSAFVAAEAATMAGDPASLAQSAAAQRMYAQVVARDSNDAEAWYGLADAHYHAISPTGLDSGTLARWTTALAAFNRTLALDSSFHLAYSHKVDMYERAARPASPLVLDGETLRLLRDDAARRAFGVERLAALKARARQLAIRDARLWAASDAAPQAYYALARIQLAAGHFDSAAAVLAEGAARSAPGSTTLPFTRAERLAHVDPAAARDALRDALRTARPEALRENGGGDRFPYVLEAAAVAGMLGDLRGVDSVTRLAAAIEPTPYNSTVPTARVAAMWAASLGLAMGAPPAALRPVIDAGLAAIDRQPPGAMRGDGLASLAVPYVAYVVTRDPRYLATVRRWRSPLPDPAWAELDALEALRVGDSVRARTLARTFPSADSTRAAHAPVFAARWVARAEVLTALGDARGALQAYDVLDPTRLVTAGYVEPALALWARSFLARGRLYERLGRKADAAAAYERFATLWKDADPALQSQVREARAGLLRIRDPKP